MVKYRQRLSCVALVILICRSAGVAAADGSVEKETVWSVADNIALARVARGGNETGAQFEYSKDGAFVAFITERPKLVGDQVDSELLVYRVAELKAFARGANEPRPVFRAAAASHSSAPAIEGLSWSTTKNELYFLVLDGRRARLQRWRNGSAGADIIHDNVIRYSLLSSGALAAFIANDRVRDQGTSIVMTDRSIASALGGGPWYLSQYDSGRIFFLNTQTGEGRLYDALAYSSEGAALSASGRYLSFAEPLNAQWRGRCWTRRSGQMTTDSPAFQVGVLDLVTGNIWRPFNAPLASSILFSGGTAPAVVWRAGTDEAIATFTFDVHSECRVSNDALPGMFVFSPTTREIKRIHSFTLNSIGIVDFLPHDIAWSEDGQRITMRLDTLLSPIFPNGAPKLRPGEETLRFRRNTGKWTFDARTEVRAGPPVKQARQSPILVIQQSHDVLPTLMVSDRAKRSRVLIDLASAVRGKVIEPTETVRWSDAAGRRWSGLVAVPHGTNGPLPLIVQTHGNSDLGAFFAEGPTTSAYPGRAALERGFVVLTVFDTMDEIYTGPRAAEPGSMTAGYAAGIQSLVQRGLVDPKKIGVIGYSRTSYYIKHALTHQPDLFQVAVVDDGVDYGYGQYLTDLDYGDNSFAQQYDATYGGPPWATPSRWLAEAPGFNAHRVRVPVRIEALSGLASLLWEWEFYAVLQRAGKTVDLIAYPDGTHNLYRPSQRAASTQGALDWLDYWLTGRRRSSSADETQAQYTRWDQMRRN